MTHFRIINVLNNVPNLLYILDNMTIWPLGAGPPGGECLRRHNFT